MDSRILNLDLKSEINFFKEELSKDVINFSSFNNLLSFNMKLKKKRFPFVYISDRINQVVINLLKSNDKKHYFCYIDNSNCKINYAVLFDDNSSPILNLKRRKFLFFSPFFVTNMSCTEFKIINNYNLLKKVLPNLDIVMTAFEDFYLDNKIEFQIDKGFSSPFSKERFNDNSFVLHFSNLEKTNYAGVILERKEKSYSVLPSPPLLSYTMINDKKVLASGGLGNFYNLSLKILYKYLRDNNSLIHI